MTSLIVIVKHRGPCTLCLWQVFRKDVNEEGNESNAIKTKQTEMEADVDEAN